MNWKRALIPALLLSPLFVVFGLGFGKDPHAIPFALEGQAMPAFELVALDGKPLASRALAGKPLVLNFWSTWCVPCKVEHEVLQSGAQAWGDRVTFVGVVYQDEQEAAREYLETYRSTYAQVMDPGSKLAIELGVSGVPETFFIDGNGIVRGKFAGPVTPGYLHAAIEKLTRSGS